MDVKLFLRVALLALLASAAQAQNYPTKPIIDGCRSLPAARPTLWAAPSPSHDHRAQAVRDHRECGGAGGTSVSTGSPRRGRTANTILLHHIGMAHQPGPVSQAQLQPAHPISNTSAWFADVPMTLIAKEKISGQGFQGAARLRESEQGQVTLANAGLGAASHLCGLLFMSAIETDLTTVPYKGTGPAMNDILGGQVDLLCDQTPTPPARSRTARSRCMLSPPRRACLRSRMSPHCRNSVEGLRKWRCGTPSMHRGTPSRARCAGRRAAVRAEGRQRKAADRRSRTEPVRRTAPLRRRCRRTSRPRSTNGARDQEGGQYAGLTHRLVERKGAIGPFLLSRVMYRSQIGAVANSLPPQRGRAGAGVSLYIHHAS